MCACVVGWSREGEVCPYEAFLMFQFEICRATAGPGEEEHKTESLAFSECPQGTMCSSIMRPSAGSGSF